MAQSADRTDPRKGAAGQEETDATIGPRMLQPMR